MFGLPKLSSKRRSLGTISGTPIMDLTRFSSSFTVFSPIVKAAGYTSIHPVRGECFGRILLRMMCVFINHQFTSPGTKLNQGLVIFRSLNVLATYSMRLADPTLMGGGPFLPGTDSFL